MPEFNQFLLSITVETPWIIQICQNLELPSEHNKKNVNDLNTSVIISCMVNSFWCSQCVEFMLSYFTGIRSILFKETTN